MAYQSLENLARHIEYTNLSIQHTADQERRIHEEALQEAHLRHEEVRITAEREAEKIRQELASQQRHLDQQETLRAEKARREAEEKAYQLERETQEAIAAAQAARDAAERQRKANAEAKRALEKQRPPSPLPVAQPKTQPVQVVTPAPQSIQTPSAPVPQATSLPEGTVPALANATAARTAKGLAAATPVAAASTTSKTQSSTYQGLPLPSTLPPTLQKQYLEYIDILMSLKEHRKIFMKQIVTSPQYASSKSQVGESRREIRKLVSQLTEDKVANNNRMKKVIDILAQSLRSRFPEVSFEKFAPGAGNAAPNINSFFIYLTNIFTKAVFSQFLVEASTNSKKADIIGLFASQTLANMEKALEYRIYLWPILLAKFARRCAVLFGVYGPDSTTEGKVLLGWGKEDGRFVTDQRHAERMTALSSGWASITLRDYDKSQSRNPAAPWYFWRSMALLLNVPENNVTNTHFLVVKGLLEHNEARILKLFGDHGWMLLKQAVIQFPNNRHIGHSTAAQGLRLLRDIWAKNFHFVLE